MADYDDREAKALVGRKHGKTRETVAARNKAAVRLVDAVLALHDVYGLSVERDQGFATVFLSMGEAAAVLRWRDNEGFALRAHSPHGEPSKWFPVALVYNADADLFEGHEDDTFYIPEAGTPRRKRSALAVIVEAALYILRPNG